MASFRRNKKGFTLIELLVVIAIIGILGAIVAVSTTAIMKNARKNAASSRLRSDWKITATAFNQINKGFTTTKKPTKDLLATRLGTTKVLLGTENCPNLDDDYVYIKYEETNKVNAKYKVVAIYTKYKDKYYYTTDGQTITGPKSSP